MSEPLLLAADVGGTKILLALVDPACGVHEPLIVRSLPSADFGSLDAAVASFLAETGARCEVASIGVAGPVIGGRAALTNLAWTVDAEALAHRFALRRVVLLNDLVATAASLPVLGAGDLVTLQEGTPEPRGARGIIAPGTGLGQAFLTWENDVYVPHPSEGGHCDFAPRGETERRLLRFLEAQFGHVSYERVCSGRGIANIYRFFRGEGLAEYPDLARQVEEAEDFTPLIVADAMEAAEPSEISTATLGLFASVLAAEAGNLALTVMATGGLYLGGGIPPRIVPLLRSGAFAEAFRGKGRMTEILARVPLHVILRADAALLGAAAHGVQSMRRMR